MKNGTLASPAMARASSVLPVPGGPTSSAPRGIRPPRRWNFCGSRRNSTISSRSLLASSTPATSSNVTRPWRSVSSLARDLPKPIARPEPDCIWRMKNIHTPISSSIGNQLQDHAQDRGLSSSDGRALNLTPLSRKRSTSCGSCGAYVVKRVVRVPQRPVDTVAGDFDIGHLSAVHVGKKLGIGNLVLRVCFGPGC